MGPGIMVEDSGPEVAVSGRRPRSRLRSADSAPTPSAPRTLSRRRPELVSETHCLPVTQTNLTPAERALLRDPSRVTEDDADAILGLRRERAEKPVHLVPALNRDGWRMRRPTT
jgi:hypothetical protein